MRASMHISLPEGMKEWVDEQVESGGYGTASEYVRELLRKEQRRRVRMQIDESLLEALDSGLSTPLRTTDWDRIRQEGRKLARSRKRE